MASEITLEDCKESLLLFVYLDIGDTALDDLRNDLSEEDFLELQKWWEQWSGIAMRELNDWLINKLDQSWT